MTVPSLSWIEPDELSEALVRAGVRRQPRSVPQRRGPVVRPEGRSSPRGRLGATAAELPASSASRFQAPDGTLLTQLEAFFEWVAMSLPALSLFIADEGGLMVLERETDESVVALASSFMKLLERVSTALELSTEGIVAVDLKPDRILYLVRAATEHMGYYTLGFTVHRPVDRKLIAQLRSNLEKVIHDDASG